MKNLLIIGALALPGLSFLDVPAHWGCDADPLRAQPFVPGVSTLWDMVRELGGPANSDIGEDRDAPFSACWYSGSGPRLEPERMRLDWRLDAEFDSRYRLLRIRLKGQKRERTPLACSAATEDLADLRPQREDETST